MSDRQKERIAVTHRVREVDELARGLAELDKEPNKIPHYLWSELRVLYNHAAAAQLAAQHPERFRELSERHNRLVSRYKETHVLKQDGTVDFVLPAQLISLATLPGDVTSAIVSSENSARHGNPLHVRAAEARFYATVAEAQKSPENIDRLAAEVKRHQNLLADLRHRGIVAPDQSTPAAPAPTPSSLSGLDYDVVFDDDDL